MAAVSYRNASLKKHPFGKKQDLKIVHFTPESVVHYTPDCIVQYRPEYSTNANLHRDKPFKKDFFRTIINTRILYDNQEKFKKWLNQSGFPSDKSVFLSWDTENGMVVPWRLLIKYFDSFYYPSSDDLTVIDQSLDWALLFFHNDEVYFGTNTDFKPSESDGNN